MTIGRLPPLTDPTFVGKLQNALDQIQSQKQSRNRPYGPLPHYTVATVPPAGDWTYCAIYVTNGASGLSVAVSDGTAWRWTGTGAVIT